MRSSMSSCPSFVAVLEEEMMLLVCVCACVCVCVCLCLSLSLCACVSWRSGAQWSWVCGGEVAHLRNAVDACPSGCSPARRICTCEGSGVGGHDTQSCESLVEVLQWLWRCNTGASHWQESQWREVVDVDTSTLFSDVDSGRVFLSRT